MDHVQTFCLDTLIELMQASPVTQYCTFKLTFHRISEISKYFWVLYLDERSCTVACGQDHQLCREVIHAHMDKEHVYHSVHLLYR